MRICRLFNSLLMFPSLASAGDSQSLGIPFPREGYQIIRHRPSTLNYRRNRNCRYYGHMSKGYYTEEKEGDPCGLCGG